MLCNALPCSARAKVLFCCQKLRVKCVKSAPFLILVVRQPKASSAAAGSVEVALDDKSIQQLIDCAWEASG